MRGNHFLQLGATQLTVWIIYFGLYDRELFPTLGNNTTVWIMYLGLYYRESLRTLGNNIVF